MMMTLPIHMSKLKVEPRDVPAIKQLLSQGKVNESEESED